VTGPQYRAAVVGCGRIGVSMEADPKRIRPATHAGAYRGCPRTRLVALTDVVPARVAEARTLFPGVDGFTDVADMLERVRPDVVSVATPATQHRAVVEACAKHGVPAVVCEKPLADTLEDGRAMVAACAASGTRLLVNHTRRFDPLLRALRAEIAGGGLGRVMQATGYYTAGIFNTGTHMVDLLRFFLGDVAWVVALTNDGCSHAPGDLNVDALLGFVSGARAALQAQEVKDYTVFTLRLHGASGTAVVDRFGFEVERTPVRECAEFSGYNELDVHAARRTGQSRSFMAPLVEHVVACLDGGDVPASRGEDGLAAVEILLALKASAEQGGRRMTIGGHR
jgi:predicted dehydrogenase